jgi:hypothetical protein
VERFKGGRAKSVVNDEHLERSSRYHVFRLKRQINQRICDNRRIIADEIASEMNFMETRAARMVKVPTEGIYSDEVKEFVVQTH